MNLISQFQSLNFQNKRYVSFGLLIALLVALPLSVWAIITGTFDIRERAQETNSCGGTCGSNYNCNSELYCYQGLCRNPFCKDSVDCVCPTATPITTASPSASPSLTPTPKSSPTATASGTPVATVSATPMFFATPSPTPTPETKTNIPYAYLIGAILFVLVLFIFLTFRKKGNKPKPPITQINPVLPVPPTSVQPAQQDQIPPVEVVPPAITEPEQQPEKPNLPGPFSAPQNQY